MEDQIKKRTEFFGLFSGKLDCSKWVKTTVANILSLVISFQLKEDVNLR